MDKKAAWNMFMQTGKVEDYLGYIHAKNDAAQSAVFSDIGEEPLPDADDDRWAGDNHRQYGG